MVSFLKRLLLRDAANGDNINAGQYPFLVTGCARSGTHFIAKFLQLNGMDIGHEATGALGAVHWLCASEGYCKTRRVSFGKTLHLIRNPFLTVRSLQTINPRAWSFIYQYLPECRHDDRMVAGARYWMGWNRLALAKASLTVRLEDFQVPAADKTVQQLGDFFARPLDPMQIEASLLSQDSRKARWDYGHDMSMAHVAKNDPATYREMRTFAESFGYSLEEGMCESRNDGR